MSSAQKTTPFWSYSIYADSLRAVEMGLDGHFSAAFALVPPKKVRHFAQGIFVLHHATSGTHVVFDGHAGDRGWPQARVELDRISKLDPEEFSAFCRLNARVRYTYASAAVWGVLLRAAYAVA